MATHSEIMENHQQQTNNQNMATHNSTIRINPHDTTNPDWANHKLPPLPITMPPAMGAISDTYINPWGDHLEQPKPPDTV